jgi:NAD(P)-dependent dehydrogenase (short-subunit alcohol dehydrogenase family)
VDDVGSGEAGPGSLAGRRIVVVGASSGIGREIVVAATRAGALVVAAARRFDQLRELAGKCGPTVHPVVCDVRSAMGCELAVRSAADFLGAFDTLVFATGINHLGLLEDTPSGAWLEMLETNLVGAAVLTRAALPYLRRSAKNDAGGRRPRAAYLSSHSVARPWPGLGAYAASKAGLDTLVEAWRAECPEVDFTRVVVGPTITGMADDWDRETATTMFERWAAEGYLGEHAPVEASVVASDIVDWIGDDEVPAELRLV